MRSGRSVIAAGRVRRDGPVIEPSWMAASSTPRLQTIPTCVSQRRGLVFCARARSWLYSTQRLRVTPPPSPLCIPLLHTCPSTGSCLGSYFLQTSSPIESKLGSDAKIGRPVRNKSKRQSDAPFGILATLLQICRGRWGEGNEVQGSLGVFALWLLQRGLSLPEGCYGNSI